MEHALPDNLPSDPSSLKELLRNALSAIEAKDFALHLAQNENARLRELVKLFQRKQFGPSSEQYAGQPCLFNEAEAEVVEAQTSTEIKGHNRKRQNAGPFRLIFPE